MKIQGDEIMRQDYQTLSHVTLGQKKKYLNKIIQDQGILGMVNDCMTIQSFENFINEVAMNKKIFVYALHALYQSSDYDQLEYHLIMMNALFHYQSFTDLKKQLFTKISKKTITINEYCVIRHLIDFQATSFSQLIQTLYVRYEVEPQECAKICLLEDQYHLAYQYLKLLPDCQDQKLLDLLCSYSIYDYVSLMRHYSKQRKGYQLATSH